MSKKLLNPQRIVTEIACGISQKRMCWALAQAVADLRIQGDYSGLNNFNLETIAESRAGNRITAHWKDLPQEEKFADMGARHELRARGHSMCYLARLCSLINLKVIPQPFVHLASISKAEWKALDAKARELATKDKIQELTAHKDGLEVRIRGLRRSLNPKKRQKAS